jgi:hypothetical protein
VTYGPIDDLPFPDVDAWEDLDLPVVTHMRTRWPLISPSTARCAG